MSGFYQIYNIVEIRNNLAKRNLLIRSYPDIALFPAFRKDL